MYNFRRKVLGIIKADPVCRTPDFDGLDTGVSSNQTLIPSSIAGTLFEPIFINTTFSFWVSLHIYLHSSDYGGIVYPENLGIWETGIFECLK
jgi:hypothetical protein